MGLIQWARMNGHDPYAYLKDVLPRLPTQQASEIERLLPHHGCWASLRKAYSRKPTKESGTRAAEQVLRLSAQGRYSMHASHNA